MLLTMVEIPYCLPNGNAKPRNKPFALDSALFDNPPLDPPDQAEAFRKLIAE